MKRILAIIITLTIVWTAFFISGSEAFASGQLVETKPTPSNPVVNPSKSSESLSKQADDLIAGGFDGLKQVSQAALEYYFNVLLTDHYGVSSDDYPRIRFDEDYYYIYSDYVTSDAKPIRAVSNGRNLNCFNPDYLYDYFIILCADDDKCDYDSAGFLSSYILEHGNTLSFLMNQIHKTGLSPSMALSVLTPNSGSYDFETFSNYYNSLYAKYLAEHNQSVVSVGYESYNPNTYINDFRIPSENFATAINNNTTALTTSQPTTLVSWKNNYYANSSFDKIRDSSFLSIMSGGKWFGIGKDVYACFYVNIGGVTYYGDEVINFHFGDYSFTDVNGNVVTTTDAPIIDYYSAFSTKSDSSLTYYPRYSRSQLLPTLVNFNVTSFDDVYMRPSNFNHWNCISFQAFPKSMYFTGKSSGSDYGVFSLFTINPDSNVLASVSSCSLSANQIINSSSSADSKSLVNLQCTVGDKSTYFYRLLDVNFNDNPFVVNGSLSVNDTPCDYGYLVCSKRFEIGSLTEYLKPEQIPSNSYVTISGDSFYDYSITNTDTGQTNNFGDFMNNGYMWVNNGSGNQTNTGGGSGGGGGGTGGNVNVSGDVNVSGSIDVGGSVDININVNGGGGGNGGGGNGNSYDFGTDSFDDILSDALSDSVGIRQFMELFFGFLPPRLVFMLGLLILLVIFKVVFFRR